MLNHSCCCKKLFYLLSDPESPFEYDAKRRYYSVTNKAPVFLTRDEICLSFQLFYCPLCGYKFPKDLANEWYEIIEKEYNIEGILDSKLQDIPEEFKTDAWWKKRNL